MARQVQIGKDRVVGDGAPCFIIAEAGSNHSGHFEQAKRLIDVAAGAGADAVKFQLFRASRLYPKTAGRSDYLKLDRSIYDIIAEMELPYEWVPKLAAACREKGILFMASSFDEESADFLDPYVEVHKIASYEMTHLPLVRHIAKMGKPVVVSTGTSSQAEVAETVAEFLKTENQNILLMQCTAAYPAPVESLNIRAVATLKAAFQVPVGLSDHSRDPLIGPLAAVAVGANLIEKHFTLSNDLPGPDHRFAILPDELKRMVRGIRDVEKSLGTGVKERQAAEEELYRFARRSIFAVQPIRSGERILPGSILILRNGKNVSGLPPRLWEEVIGRQATRNIEPGEPIGANDVGWDPLLTSST